MRRVRTDEVERWNALAREHHYLVFKQFCGNQLRHVAVQGEHWLVLVGCQAAALHCGVRDRWIGWTPLQRGTRLFLMVNTRFVLLPEAGGTPRLASRVLGKSLRRLGGDWPAVHGYDVLLASC